MRIAQRIASSIVSWRRDLRGGAARRNLPRHQVRALSADVSVVLDDEAGGLAEMVAARRPGRGGERHRETVRAVTEQLARVGQGRGWSGKASSGS
jgi:hypothetical protein